MQLLIKQADRCEASVLQEFLSKQCHHVGFHSKINFRIHYPEFIILTDWVQSLSCVRLFATLWTAARWASLSTPTPRAYSNSCPWSWWCYPTISSSAIPFSSHLQSFPASGSFTMSQFFASEGQSIGVPASASVLPMNIQDWFPWGLTGWISCLGLQWLKCSKMKNAT